MSARAWLLASGWALMLGCTTTIREAEPLDFDDPVTPQRAEPLTIRRSVLDDVLSKGPGRFFERVEVEPYFAGKRNFVGFRLKTFYGGMTPTAGGVQVGDVVTAINGLPLSRPEEFMRIWRDAGTRDSVEIDVIRDGARKSFDYRVVSDPRPEPSDAPSDDAGPSDDESGRAPSLPRARCADLRQSA